VHEVKYEDEEGGGGKTPDLPKLGLNQASKCFKTAAVLGFVFGTFAAVISLKDDILTRLCPGVGIPSSSRWGMSATK